MQEFIARPGRCKAPLSGKPMENDATLSLRSLADGTLPMKRRDFNHGLLSMLAAASWPLGGCDRRSEPSAPPIRRPSFSSERFQSQLEAMRQAFEAKGLRVSDTLLPPVDAETLARECAWFPAPLPKELTALYGWRGGQAEDAWSTEYPFWFRDDAFCSLRNAEREYLSMMSGYAGAPAISGLTLTDCFPFAAFNGGWLVLPCSPQTLDSRLARPVVSVMEGAEIFFYSMQTMVDTCLEWISHPLFSADGSLPPAIELAIWRRHNPGIFAS